MSQDPTQPAGSNRGLIKKFGIAVSAFVVLTTLSGLGTVEDTSTPPSQSQQTSNPKADILGELDAEVSDLTPIVEEENEIPIPEPTPPKTYKVTKVIDGDTIKANINGSIKSIRLIGINAPESGACLATKSTNFLKDQVLNKKVELIRDNSQDNKDKYGRLLRYIFLSDENINGSIVAEGLAKEYTYKNNPYNYQSDFRSSEGAAKDLDLGIWGDSCACKKGKQVSRKCVACNQAKVTYKNYDCSTYTRKITDYNCSSKCYVAPPTPSYTCNCSKTCGQLTCTEAYYQLNTCGCLVRDGDGDGVPCESICPGG